MKKAFMEIYENLKESYNSLWSYKIHAESIEVITPLVTITSKFVSVFITIRKGKFVVTDGGNINDGDYGVTPDYNDEIFYKILTDYSTFYEVKTTDSANADFAYYKTSVEIERVPSIIFDMVNFITGVVNASSVIYVDEKEKSERDGFFRSANDYLKETFGPKRTVFSHALSEFHKSIRFNAAINEPNGKLTLVNYITGSTTNYFLGSIGRSNINFEIATDFLSSDILRKKIALVNDRATGYNIDKMNRQLGYMASKNDIEMVFWSNMKGFERLWLQ
ncbi:hypothetical protein [Larkinella punicea]|uniref:DUF1828 domain-containing protein n=1 Tax=Larkinella punicea TaxID=2315727 RepID=A0A368JNQ5_9BACT|nr:hypothetical protein [Larkinella punicea]RCR68284.1 hypothetical protein DUE52_17975 [Larkinella punicea]